jgi:hypothetical protein
MFRHALPAALVSLLVTPACTLDSYSGDDDDDDDVLITPLDAGYWVPDSGAECWTDCGDAGGGPIDPVDPGGDGGTPPCDAGSLAPTDGGIDPWPDPEPDGGIDPWPDPYPDAGIDPSPVRDAGTGTDCSWITSEAICIVLSECTAWYEGVDCVCDSDGVCDCADWEFVYCE